MLYYATAEKSGVYHGFPSAMEKEVFDTQSRSWRGERQLVAECCLVVSYAFNVRLVDIRVLIKLLG
jgi:hypothetical protein